MARIGGLVLLLALPLMAACSRSAPAPSSTSPVTLAIVNARVWTGDPERPSAEAVAISGDRIVAAGSSDEIRQLAAASTRGGAPKALGSPAP